MPKNLVKIEGALMQGVGNVYLDCCHFIWIIALQELQRALISMQFPAPR